VADDVTQIAWPERPVYVPREKRRSTEANPPGGTEPGSESDPGTCGSKKVEP
jgi:hypothetical protein